MSKQMTVADVVKNNLCHGCGTCAGLCPSRAIEMKNVRRKGVYLAKINPKLCTDCGLCYKLCPGNAVSFKEKNKTPSSTGFVPLFGTYPKCFTGYSTEEKIRYNSSSGGLVSSILIYALEKGDIDGALVTRMKKHNPTEPEAFVARTKKEILEAAGSKYCPVPVNSALQEIMANDGKYAIVGLPCHIHGIRKAEAYNPKLKERISLHLGIFCGYSQTFLGTEHLLKKINIDIKEVTQLNYRGEGWPGYMTIQTRNGPSKLLSYEDYYNNTFISFVPWRCLLCPDQINLLADISLGDAWLPEIIKTDHNGTSIIICRSKTSEILLNNMENEHFIELVPTSLKKVNQSQLTGGVTKSQHAGTFLTFARLSGKKVPSYDLELPAPDAKSFFQDFVFLVECSLISHRSLWWLLDFYFGGLKILGRIKSKVIRKKASNV